jgi:hypothetical protein
MPRMGADPTGHRRRIKSANRRPVQPSTAPSAIGKTICLALGSLVLTDCSIEVREPPQIEPRPAVYPRPPQPPPPEAEQQRPPPSAADAIWVSGHQRWNGEGYVWEPGHYERPPIPGAHFIAGRWQRQDGGYVWVEEHWL